ncbi:MAG: hypothetical protein FJ267_06730, partial [Planctomycetes bacterium]|nr:hypothetical protein [Planctomycetota bacterium]
MNPRTGLLNLVIIGTTIVFESFAVHCGHAQDATDLLRHVVRVNPVELPGRSNDERPAEFRLDSSLNSPGRRIDLSSISVHPWNPDTKTASSEGLGIRWYDESIPYQFPVCEQNLHSTDGIHLRVESRPRWGDFFHVVGEGEAGRLVWNHRQ